MSYLRIFFKKSQNLDYSNMSKLNKKVIRYGRKDRQIDHNYRKAFIIGITKNIIKFALYSRLF